MKGTYYQLFAILLLSACNSISPESNYRILSGNKSGQPDTVIVTDNKLATQPFKKEPKMHDFEQNAGYVKTIQAIQNRYDPEQHDAYVMFKNGANKVMFYQMPKDTFLESYSCVTNEGYFDALMTIGNPIEPLLARLNIEKIKLTDFVLLIYDEEELDLIQIQVVRRKINGVSCESILD
ncbi:MAG: hypothetical protein WCR52_21785 [Bacteroidota bacterium]